MVNILIKNDNFAYITTDDVRLFNLIKRSFIRKERVYNNYYKLWETKNRIYYSVVDNGNTIKIKAGLVSFLCASFIKCRIKYNIIDKRKKLALDIQVVTQLSENIKLKNYQEDAVYDVLANPFCCLQLPTGTGKTEVAASIIRSFLNYYKDSEAVLYAVPTIKLQNEAKERFEKYGIKVNTNFPIKKGYANALTFSALIRASTEKFDYIQRDSIGAVIWDEAHHLSADKLNKVVHRLHNLRLNVGMSATISNDIEQKEKLCLKELNGKELLVYGCTGKIIHNMEITESIEENFVVPIEVHVVKNIPKHTLSADDIDWQLVKNVILKDRDRAKLIAKYAYHIMQDANLHTVSMLIPEIAWSRLYMSIVSNIFKDTDIRVFELYGGNRIYEYKDKNSDNPVCLTSKEEKEEAFNAIKDPNIRTIFSATTFFFEGINMPSIQAIINCYGGRDTKRVRQQCGRAMRLFEGKDVAYIHEIQDLHNPILESQFRNRIRVYTKEYNAKIIYSTFKI